MIASQILTELSQRPAAEINADLERVRAEKVRLEMEEQMLSQVLRLKDYAENGEVPGQQRLASGGTIPEHILGVYEEARGASWTPGAMGDALRERGLDATNNAVRVAMRRLHQRDQKLTRDDDGHGPYRLAPSDDRRGIF